jgi:isopentenyl diphosphate isomerase/L-lactate dehydrogenase-like FMN-dependent dehydrogenase
MSAAGSVTPAGPAVDNQAPYASGMAESSDVGAGRLRQGEIYSAGVSGRRPRVPTSFAELEARARRVMSARAWAYVYGGAGEGATMAANRAALDRWQIVPRMLRDVSGRDLATTVLDTTLAAPLLLAPVGAAGLVVKDADVLIGAGAADAGIPYILSTQGSAPMEATAAAMGDQSRWYQLYWSRDEELTDSLIGRAEAIGAEALVVTLDTGFLGWRPWDLNLGSLPFSQGIGIAQYTSDPRFAELVAQRLASPGPKPDVKVTLAAIRTLFSIAGNHPGSLLGNLRRPEPRAAVETFLDVFSNPALSWDHIATLRDRTRLPVVLKGVLHPDDARRAFDAGVDAVMVSNHGGRQVDGAVGALDALVAVRDAVGPTPVVLLDSGIRTGADVFKALALGADAVTLGRPHLYGLALDGRRGVEAVIRNVIAELDLTMGLSGVTSLAEIDRSTLRPVG